MYPTHPNIVPWQLSTSIVRIDTEKARRRAARQVVEQSPDTHEELAQRGCAVLNFSLN